MNFIVVELTVQQKAPLTQGQLLCLSESHCVHKAWSSAGHAEMLNDIDFFEGRKQEPHPTQAIII